jgi:HAD superfamily hydrolase (TIGR01459 family)
MELLPGMRAIADRYDGFILDLWGVVHDGITLYPGAAACMAALKQAGKRVALLSNAPRRTAQAAEAMRAMGMPDGLYDAILTSGEATHEALLWRRDPWFARLGTRVFHLGPERDRGVIEGLDLVLQPAPSTADFVLNTGPDDRREYQDIAEFEDTLEACAGLDLPMVCANPDLEVIRGGRRALCAGALAVRYQELGGEMRWLGKPDPVVFHAVLRRLNLPPARVAMVGDALRTDIAGAKAAGLDAIWVLGGIHGAALGDPPDMARAAAEAASWNTSPVAAVRALTW